MAKIKTNHLVIICIMLGIAISSTVIHYASQMYSTFTGEEYEYICTQCGETFTSQKELEDHMLHEHGTQPTDIVAVYRHIDWQVYDDYGGGGFASVYIYVYDPDLHLFEGDGSAYKTGTDGTLESGMNYRSGQQLKVKLVEGNAKAWYNIIVPKMPKQDAEVLTANPVSIAFFHEIGETTTPTFTMDAGGTAISDGGTYNATLSGDQKTFTFSVHCQDDNTGFKESFDPTNDINWYACVYLKQFEGGYETIDLSGFDDVWEKGDALYYAKRITPEGQGGITRYKVGNNYVWSGSWAFSFTGDFTGYDVATADWDIFVYTYTDPAYYEGKASFGPDSVQLGSTFDVINIYGTPIS